MNGWMGKFIKDENYAKEINLFKKKFDQSWQGNSDFHHANINLHVNVSSPG